MKTILILIIGIFIGNAWGDRLTYDDCKNQGFAELVGKKEIVCSIK